MTMVLGGARQSEGTWLHTGHLTITAVMPNGTTLKVTLPDDWVTSIAGLNARVTALEAAIANMPNSLEDLTYGG